MSWGALLPTYSIIYVTRWGVCLLWRENSGWKSGDTVYTQYIYCQVWEDGQLQLIPQLSQQSGTECLEYLKDKLPWIAQGSWLAWQLECCQIAAFDSSLLDIDILLFPLTIFIELNHRK